MRRKKSNLSKSKHARLMRAKRAQESEEQIAARNAAQRIRTADLRRKESQEQRDERLRKNRLRQRLTRKWQKKHSSESTHITLEAEKHQNVEFEVIEEIKVECDNFMESEDQTLFQEELNGSMNLVMEIKIEPETTEYQLNQ